MADFLLEPSEIEPEPSTRRPTRVTSAGLAPTADIPTGRRVKEHPPCYVPCEGCGVSVLLGRTQAGERLAMDTGRATYTVHWPPGQAEPVLSQSRGYPVHQCQAAQ